MGDSQFDNPFEKYQELTEEEEYLAENPPLDLSGARKEREHFKHQIDGINSLHKWNDPKTGRVLGGCFALFDEMGIGKTRQVVDAAERLFLDGKINQVLVIAPAAVRSVWWDKEFGELKKYMWHNVPNRVVYYHKQIEYWDWYIEDRNEPYLRWILCNYEFVRLKSRMYGVIDWLDGAKTMLVLDESSAVKSPRAKQSKACMDLRGFCDRVVLLNGTPIANSPRDMYSQGNIMDPDILKCPSIEAFMNRYSRKVSYGRHARVEWIGLESLQEAFKPYVLRRLKKDCLDLPEKMEPVTLTAPLDEKTWEIYKKLRDEFIVWLTTPTENEHASMLKAQQTIVKALRLAQLCGGFVGGVESDAPPVFDPNNPDFLQPPEPETREVGREKLDLLLSWIETKLNEDEYFKLSVWCRFRLEQIRLVKEIRAKWPHVKVGRIHGGQSTVERDAAVRLLNPDTSPSNSAVIVVGSPQAGGMGLNLAAAHHVVYYSNDYNMKTRLQSEDRFHRPGQEHAVAYFDIVATGPRGQQTMDHTIIRAIREKEDLANWTTSAWLDALGDAA